jgi:hypothetical protein
MRPELVADADLRAFLELDQARSQEGPTLNDRSRLCVFVIDLVECFFC